MKHIVDNYIHRIADLLAKEQDHYLYHGKYGWGLEEFGEAVSFLHYLRSGNLIDKASIDQYLQFPAPKPVVPVDPGESAVSTPGSEPANQGAETAGKTAVPESAGDGSQGPSAEPKAGPADTNDKSVTEPATDSTTKDSPSTEQASMPESNSGDPDKPTPPEPEAGPGSTIQLLFKPLDYVLAVGDLTGELMRFATGSMNQGDIERPFHVRDFLATIFNNFQSLDSRSIRWKPVQDKLRVLRQSLLKVEKVCYMITLRKAEVPPDVLGKVIAMAVAAGRDDIDEGIGGEFD